jgi:activator of 2-hydroxyglutaryl-CoA dehydratase
MKLVGVDVGSTTVKAVVVADGAVTWQDYQRHNTKQAEKVVEFLGRMEAEAGLATGVDRVFFTGSGAGFIAPLVGGKLIQEVVAVAACVEQLHPDVRFVSEIGGEDMKTIFFTASGTGKSKQHVHREDRPQAASAERAPGRDGLRQHEPAQDLEQMRDLRRD